MEMIPKSEFQSRAYNDHADAWLMSYADLITLLSMFFVIFVSVVYSKHSASTLPSQGEPEHPYIERHSGLLSLSTTYDDMFRSLQGIVDANSVDHDVAVEKTKNGLMVDMASPLFFDPGSADFRADERPLLESLVAKIKTLPVDSSIEVDGYTDDTPLEHSSYANNWELSAMRATRIATLLINAGIDGTRLHSASYADNRPAVPNNDNEGNPIEENHLRNQRVVIRIESKPGAPLTGLE